jgi:hypothetical protein
VDKGILIAFRPNSQYVIPAADGKSVEIGSGCKWEDVYRTLEPLGKTVVGGRFGDVGVTGLTLGGGFSYLSAQHVSYGSFQKEKGGDTHYWGPESLTFDL